MPTRSSWSSPRPSRSRRKPRRCWSTASGPRPRRWPSRFTPTATATPPARLAAAPTMTKPRSVSGRCSPGRSSWRRSRPSPGAGVGKKLRGCRSSSGRSSVSARGNCLAWSVRPVDKGGGHRAPRGGLPVPADVCGVFCVQAQADGGVPPHIAPRRELAPGLTARSLVARAEAGRVLAHSHWPLAIGLAGPSDRPHLFGLRDPVVSAAAHVEPDSALSRHAVRAVVSWLHTHRDDGASLESAGHELVLRGRADPVPDDVVEGIRAPSPRLPCRRRWRSTSGPSLSRPRMPPTRAFVPWSGGFALTVTETLLVLSGFWSPNAFRVAGMGRLRTAGRLHLVDVAPDRDRRGATRHPRSVRE